MNTATKKFTTVEMPVGYYEFHPVPHMNFQINRWHSSGGYDKKTAEYAGKHIQTFDDWTRVWKELGQKAESDGELRNAAFCYRAAEFFTDPHNPEKTALYDQFIELFYTVHKDDPIETHEIPYKTGALHTLRVVPPHPRGMFVIHGGGDSFAEEFLPYMIHWYDRGYEVINFEGSGQGSVIHKHGLGFEWQWEHCTKAVLDYFKIEECAFMGISFGGWFCIRAAAHEPRITKLVAFNALSNVKKSFLMSMSERARNVYITLMENEDKEGFIALKKKLAVQDSFLKWLDNNTMFAYNADNVYDGYRNYENYIPENQDAENIHADVFLTNCVDDHFVLMEDMELLEKMMVNAKSIEKRTFTREE